jgi:hypothetical protein
LAQETHSLWTKLLPIDLIRLRNTPDKQGLTPFESLYGRPFLTNDLLDQKTAQLISHVTQLTKFQQTLSEIKQATLREDIKGSPLFCPGDLVLIKSPCPTRDLHTPPGEGTYPIILSTPMTVQWLTWIPGSITQKLRSEMPLWISHLHLQTQNQSLPPSHAKLWMD